MMKSIFLLLLLPFFAGAIFFISRPARTSFASTNANNIAVCSPVSNGDISLNESGKFVVPLPGWGKYSYPISHTADSAQFYFDQGLNMYYGYHFKESLASFKEAARIDPSCLMAYWGQALAMGPYYNAAHTYTMPAAVQPVLQRMKELAPAAPAKEKDLAAVMERRYSNDLTDSRRKELNAAYASGLRDLISQYPQDEEIKILYVDAVMLMHAWDFWNQDGTAKAWTNELVSLSEKVLKTNPDHPAALHYHIHLTEASHHPEVALPNADKLKNLLPGIAHMVHMASHEYQRNGLYAQGVEVNDLADGNLLKYDSLAKNLSLNKHSAHYFGVQTYCAMSGGMYDAGMRAALRTKNSVMPTYENTYDQYLYMLPVLTRVRLGKWGEILKDSSKIDSKWLFASLLEHFSKGLAFVNTGKTQLAKDHLAQLREKLKDPVLLKRRIPFNAPLPVAKIAEGILNSAILFSENKPDAAIASLEEAIKIEDSLIYTEPNDWPVPARQFLGAYLLKMKKPVLAEKVYREDLILNPVNGWSSLGLYQSLEAQKKRKDLAEYKRQYTAAFSHADEIPRGSVYMR